MTIYMAPSVLLASPGMPVLEHDGLGLCGMPAGANVVMACCLLLVLSPDGHANSMTIQMACGVCLPCLEQCFWAAHLVGL